MAYFGKETLDILKENVRQALLQREAELWTLGTSWHRISLDDTGAVQDVPCDAPDYACGGVETDLGFTPALDPLPFPAPLNFGEIMQEIDAQLVRAMSPPPPDQKDIYTVLREMQRRTVAEALMADRIMRLVDDPGYREGLDARSLLPDRFQKPDLMAAIRDIARGS